MHSANNWGGTFEIRDDAASTEESSHSRYMDLDRGAVHHSRQLDETQQSWLLGPADQMGKKKKDQYVDLGCVVCKRKVLKWAMWILVAAFFLIALPIIIAKSIPKHKEKPPPPDNYSQALHKALRFFNAQKSGKLPRNNGVSWRGDSGLKDGLTDATDIKGGLVGGYYDAGDNIKFHFPLAFSMTMLSWSVIEYSAKYKALGEYDHVRDLIKWGTDYLLLTFNSSATNIDHVYSQVGSAQNQSTTPDDHYCWERPEDMDYPRPAQRVAAGPDLAGEMAAALASASIVFRDNDAYSRKLLRGADTLYRFARSNGHRGLYSKGNPFTAPFYNSTSYWDEYMWSAGWMYYASGNSSYLRLATHPSLAKNANALRGILDLRVFSWDNKVPGAELLLVRLRMFLNPGFPFEDMLQSFHNQTAINMCSYLQKFGVFNFTQGGLIQLNHGRPQPLQYAANAAFLASLYNDYMAAADVPGFVCGPNFISRDELLQFATSQVDYILGKNPRKMSYVVGYGSKYPTHVHHRGASIPHNGKKYGCTEGLKWRDAKTPNPNTIIGAMVGGPDRNDGFSDSRPNYNYTEPTMAGNAGLVAALVSLTTTGGVTGIDKNTIFSAVPPLYPAAPPPPGPWKP